MQMDKTASDVVERIMARAHKMKYRVIAEGIETPRQLERLAELGCEYGQRYYFSQPMEAKAALVYMRAQVAGSVPLGPGRNSFMIRVLADKRSKSTTKAAGGSVRSTLLWS